MQIESYAEYRGMGSRNPVPLADRHHLVNVRPKNSHDRILLKLGQMPVDLAQELSLKSKWLCYACGPDHPPTIDRFPVLTVLPPRMHWRILGDRVT